MAATENNTDHHWPRVWATCAGPCTASNLCIFWPMCCLQLQHWRRQSGSRCVLSCAPPPTPLVIPPGNSKGCHPLPPIDVVTSRSPGSVLSFAWHGTHISYMNETTLPLFSICPGDLQLSSQLGWCMEDKDAVLAERDHILEMQCWWPKKFKRRHSWKMCYFTLCYKILCTTQNQTIILIFLRTRVWLCICVHPQWGTVTTYKPVLGSQYL